MKIHDKKDALLYSIVSSAVGHFRVKICNDDEKNFFVSRPIYEYIRVRITFYRSRDNWPISFCASQVQMVATDFYFCKTNFFFVSCCSFRTQKDNIELFKKILYDSKLHQIFFHSLFGILPVLASYSGPKFSSPKTHESPDFWLMSNGPFSPNFYIIRKM